MAEPTLEVSDSSVWAVIRQGVGPFPEQGLDEVLDLSVRLWGIGPYSDVSNAQNTASLGEEPGDVASSVVGHDALDVHALGPEPAQRAVHHPTDSPSDWTYCSRKVSSSLRVFLDAR